MKGLKLKFLLLIIACTIASCDCYQNASGQIIDAYTKEPISNVLITNIDKTSNTSRSDANGHFNISTINGGFRCPPMSLKLDKYNYESQNLVIESGNRRNIELIRKPEYRNCIPDKDTINDQMVIRHPEIRPHFGDNEGDLMKYLMNNITQNYSFETSQYSVNVTFIIDEEGFLRKPCIISTKNEHSAIEGFVLQILSSMPKWTPAINENKNVASRYYFPMKITPYNKG